MTRPSCRVLFVSLVIAITLTSAGGIAASGYSLTAASSQDAVEVPTKTVDNSYGSATINSVSKLKEGESVAVSVTVDSGYPDLILRDRDNAKLAVRKNVVDGDTESFEASKFIPGGHGEVTAGTYTATLSTDEVVAAHPIVVQGYDISVTTSGTGDGDGTATISADVSKRSLPLNSNFNKVEVIVGNDNKEIQEKMTDSDGDGTYTTDVSTSNLAEKDYNTYVVVRGDKKTVLDNYEILGISDTVDLSVGDSSGDDSNDETDEQDNSQTGGQAGGQGGGQAGGQGGGGSTTDDTPPTPQEVKNTLKFFVEPKNKATLNSDGESPEKTDENAEPDQDPSQSSDDISMRVSDVTFANGNQRPMTVKNYGQPPENAREELINSIAAYNPDINPATSSGSGSAKDDSTSDTEESEDDVIEPTGSPESDGSSETGDTSTTSGASDVRVVAVANISSQSGLDNEEPAATVTMSVDKDAVTNPDKLTVYKEEYVFEAQEEQWIELETTVTNSTEDTIEVTAETTGFSLFAVIERTPDKSKLVQPNASSDQNTTTQDDGSVGQTETQAPGFGIATMVLAVLLTAVLGAMVARSS